MDPLREPGQTARVEVAISTTFGIAPLLSFC
jgi:hypothetical protein